MSENLKQAAIQIAAAFDGQGGALRPDTFNPEENHMNIEVEYTPPPQADGTVSITMPASLASKLRALLGICNSDEFDQLYGHLRRLPIAHLSLRRVDGDRAIVDLHTSFKFVEKT